MKSCLGSAAVALAVLVAAGVVAALGGWWYFSESLHEDNRTMTAAHVEGGTITVDTRNGSITVKRGPDGQGDVEIKARIRATSEERLADTSIVAERVDSGALQVRVDWAGGSRKSREGCSFDLTVPPGTKGVILSSSNGGIEIGGLAGNAVLSTSNGRIKVDHHDGSAQLESSNGGIKVAAITGLLDAETSNGSIEVTLADSSPGPVKLRTSNGGVKLEVGNAFGGTVTMDTSNGSINVSGVEGAEILSSGKKHAELRIGSADPKSQVKTSNGSIKMRRNAALPAEAPEPD